MSGVPDQHIEQDHGAGQNINGKVQAVEHGGSSGWVRCVGVIEIYTCRIYVSTKVEIIFLRMVICRNAGRKKARAGRASTGAVGKAVGKAVGRVGRIGGQSGRRA